MFDLDSINRFWDYNDRSYFILGLLGKLKGEHNSRTHLIPCTNVTSSGINVKGIVSKLVKEKKDLGFTKGPAISDRNRNLFTTNDINEMLVDILEELFIESRSLFPPTIPSKD